MQTDPWTQAPLYEQTDAPLGGIQQSQTVNKLGPWTCPHFATTAARDNALSSWVANGNTAVDGMKCSVAGIGYQILLGGTWTNDILGPASTTPLSLTANYTTTGAPWGPATVLQLGKRMRLIGSVTNAANPASATQGTSYQIGTLPAGTAPTNTISIPQSWGDGVSFVGSAPLVISPTGAVNFIAPNTFTTSLVHSISLGTVAEWVIGL